MNKLEKLIAKVLKINEISITDDLSVENCEEWGSLKHMNLIAELEETYEISFDALESMELDSIKNIKNILQRKGVEINE